MRVAVTGAAGFIGSHLCDEMLAHGASVIGIDSFSPYYARGVKEANLARAQRSERFELAELDVLDRRLHAAIEGCDAVCHLAGRPGVRSGRTSEFRRVNVGGTAAVVRAAIAAGVPRVLLASSSSAYAPAPGPVAECAQLRPISPYGRSKLRAERVAARLARGAGIELVTVRYFTVYGPRQRPDMAFARYVAAAQTGTPMALIADGRGRRDFTYVGDAVRGSRFALERGRPGGVYNLSGGRSVAVSEALGLVGSELGLPVLLESAPVDTREHIWTAADLSRARVELGYEPRVRLHDGIRRQVEAARAVTGRESAAA